MTVAGQDDAIEAIKQLKARYFRLMDTKQWDAYREVFTDDMIFYFESEDAPTATSGDEFVAFVRGRLATALTVHHGHMPEIELTSPDSAWGVWAMSDWVDDPDQHRAFQGFGHYHEEYRRGGDGQWRISRLRLSRLRVDEVAPSAGGVSRSTPAPESATNGATMAHGILLVLSEPVSEADDAAYNDWYDRIHLPEVLALSGFTSARRFRMSEVQLPSQGGFESVSSRFPHRYVATYEVEGPDLAVAAKALTEASPGLATSTAMAYDRTIAVLFEEISSR